MPYQCDDIYDLFVEYIGKISSLIKESATSNLIALGEFNVASIQYLNVYIVHNYVSDAHCTTSLLNHVLCIFKYSEHTRFDLYY